MESSSDSVVGNLCDVAHHVADVRDEIRHREIAEAAYFLSQRRDFAAGYELQDWMAAECSLRRNLCAEL